MAYSASGDLDSLWAPEVSQSRLVDRFKCLTQEHVSKMAFIYLGIRRQHDSIELTPNSYGYSGHPRNTGRPDALTESASIRSPPTRLRMSPTSDAGKPKLAP